MLLADRFELEARVGVGGSASVYRALDQTTGRNVAVKVLHPNLAEEEGPLDRFKQEVRIHRRLRHPGLTEFIASGETGGVLWMATAFVEGEPLDQYARRSPGVKTIAVWGLEICATLGWLHSRGITHRDVKPANIMIDEDGCAILLDLGIARSNSGMTMEGDLMGTPAFMAPEQALDPRDVDPRTDLFALGATLYTTATLRSAAELGYDFTRDKALANLPVALGEVVERATRSKPSERYASATEMELALAEALDAL